MWRGTVPYGAIEVIDELSGKVTGPYVHRPKPTRPVPRPPPAPALEDAALGAATLASAPVTPPRSTRGARSTTLPPAAVAFGSVGFEPSSAPQRDGDAVGLAAPGPEARRLPPHGCAASSPAAEPDSAEARDDDAAGRGPQSAAADSARKRFRVGEAVPSEASEQAPLPAAESAVAERARAPPREPTAPMYVDGLPPGPQAAVADARLASSATLAVGPPPPPLAGHDRAPQQEMAPVASTMWVHPVPPSGAPPSEPEAAPSDARLVREASPAADDVAPRAPDAAAGGHATVGSDAAAIRLGATEAAGSRLEGATRTDASAPLVSGSRAHIDVEPEADDESDEDFLRASAAIDLAQDCRIRRMLVVRAIRGER